MAMRGWGSMRCWVLAGLAGAPGCVGINPEWDGPATEGWMPMPDGRCSDADAMEGGSEDAGDEGASAGDTGKGDDVEDDACGVVEPGECGDGLVACASEGGWFCADLGAHDEHCGACFHDCGAYGEASCQDGECHCEGGPWMQLCGEACTDTRSDPGGCGIHCLDCRTTYGADARCDAGVCMPGWGE